MGMAVITDVNDIILAMILVSSVPLILYGSLISTMRERKGALVS